MPRHHIIAEHRGCKLHKLFSQDLVLPQLAEVQNLGEIKKARKICFSWLYLNKDWQLLKENNIPRCEKY